MSKFIKHIEFKKDELKSSYISNLRSQPNCGDAIYNVKGNGIDEIVFAPNSNSSGKKDRKTSFIWNFGYNEGHPCVFITFTEIDENLYNTDGAIICLETNSLTNLKNKTISVFKSGIDNILDERTKYLTWFPINEIELQTEYCLYIVGFGLTQNGGIKNDVTALFGPWKFSKVFFRLEEVPYDWQLTVNIRPTIRKIHQNRAYIHHLYHNMPEYKRVSYLKGEEYELI